MIKFLKLICPVLMITLVFTACGHKSNETFNSDDKIIKKIMEHDTFELLNYQISDSGITAALKWSFLDGETLYILVTAFNGASSNLDFNIDDCYIQNNNEKLTAEYKNEVIIDESHYYFLKFNVCHNSIDKFKLIFNKINQIAGHWEIDFDIKNIPISKYMVNKEFANDEIKVYVEYIEVSALQTKIKCDIKTENHIIPAIHLTSHIKDENNTFDYCEGSGSWSKGNSKYIIAFNGTPTGDFIIYIELKTGQKIKIPYHIDL